MKSRAPSYLWIMDSRLTTWTYATLRSLHPMSSLRPSLELKSFSFSV